MCARVGCRGPTGIVSCTCVKVLCAKRGHNVQCKVCAVSPLGRLGLAGGALLAARMRLLYCLKPLVRHSCGSDRAAHLLACLIDRPAL